jgi:hypothetical protein
MGARREQNQRISFPFSQTGVNTVKARTTSPETSLFMTTNALVDAKGALRKVPNVISYGNQVLEPTPVLAANYEMVSKVVDLDKFNWVIDNSGATGGYIAIDGNPALVCYAPSTSSGNATATYALAAGETYNTDGSYDEGFSFSFSFKASALTSTVAAAGDGVFLTFAVEEDAGLLVGLTGGRVYVYTGPGGWSSIELDEDIDDGTVHTVTLVRDQDSEDLTVTVDGSSYTYAYVFGYLGTPSGWEQTTNDKWVEVEVVNNGGAEDISVSLWGFLLRDTGDNAFTIPTYHSVSTVTRLIPESGRVEYNTFLVSDNYVWKTTNFNQNWSPVYRLSYGGARLSSYRGKAILFDFGNSSNTNVLEISPNGDYRVLDDAPPIRFGEEHNSRFWGSGDPRFPLRLYFSGVRNPNVWFAPDSDADGQESLDELLDAGWIEIPGRAGERITALYGNFYNVLAIFTNFATYILSGYNTATYQLSKLTDSVGAFSPESVVKVNNDLVSAGENGIDYLKAAEQYGDIITNKISGAIQDTFSLTGDELRRINVEVAYRQAAVTFHRQAGLLYFGYPTMQDTTNSKIMVFNLENQMWYGPIEQEHTCLDNIITGYPIRETAAFGGTDGWLKYFGPFSDGDSEIVVETQYITGRSLDPSIHLMEKVWKNLRLQVAPYGKWPIVVEWKTEGSRWESRTVYTAPKHAKLLSDDFVLGKSRLISNEEPLVLDIPIDARGKGLKIRLTTSAPKISWVDMELDFTVSGYERE